MTDVPVSSSSGGLECPRCQSPMVEKRAPFYLRGEFVGSFESLVCDICHFSLLTSSGYNEAMVQANKLGLVGPPEEIVRETIEMSEVSYAVDKPVVSTNFSATNRMFRRSNEEFKSDSMTFIDSIVAPHVPSVRQPVRRTESLVR